MNYIPHHTKKKQILARKEAALKRLIAHGAAVETLLLAAREIIDGRIRVLRAKRSKIVQKGDIVKLYSKIDASLFALRTTHPDAILAEFGFCSDM